MRSTKYKNNKLTVKQFLIILIISLPFLIITLHFTAKKSDISTSLQQPSKNNDTDNNIFSSATTSQNITTNNLFDHPIPESNIVNDDYFNDVIFIGDSVTNGIQLYKSAQNAIVISKTGLNITNIFNENVTINNQSIPILEAIKQSNRKKIYTMIGSNGIAWLENDYMISLYRDWLNTIRDAIPDCIIYVQSVLPITKELSDSNLNKENTLTNEKIDAYNIKLFDMCKEQHFHYLNVAEKFKDSNNALPENASPVDGMHINANYYNIWLNYIKSHIIEQ